MAPENRNVLEYPPPCSSSEEEVEKTSPSPSPAKKTKVDGSTSDDRAAENKSKVGRPRGRPSKMLSQIRGNYTNEAASSSKPEMLQQDAAKDLLSFYTSSCGSGIDMIAGSERTRLEKGWKKMLINELDLYVKKLELDMEKAKLVLEALKKSDN